MLEGLTTSHREVTTRLPLAENRGDVLPPATNGQKFCAAFSSAKQSSSSQGPTASQCVLE